jgi:hypothetical protein
MKLVLRVSSSNEHCDGGCELALVDLAPQLAGIALRRIAVLREQKDLDPDVDETYYWAYVVEYFSPWVSLASTEEEVEPAVKAANVLDELGIEENEVLMVPESFRVPSCQVAAVECGQMIVRALCCRSHKARYVAKSVMWHSVGTDSLLEQLPDTNAT